MGLLEDAIHEHLELKRLRGADPAEVAREQREALETPTGEPRSASVENHAGVDDSATDTVVHAPAAEPPAGGDHAGEVPQAPVASEPAHAAQETAELDMKSVMAQERATGDELAPPEDADIPDAEGDPPVPAADKDSLEWEVPARAHDAEAESAPQDWRNRDEVAETAGEPQVPDGPVDDGREGRAETQERAPGQGRLSL
jgi:hypothetical protein